MGTVSKRTILKVTTKLKLQIIEKCENS